MIFVFAKYSRHTLLYNNVSIHSGLKSEKKFNFSEDALFASKAKLNVFEGIFRGKEIFQKNVDFSLVLHYFHIFSSLLWCACVQSRKRQDGMVNSNIGKF